MSRTFFISILLVGLIYGPMSAQSATDGAFRELMDLAQAHDWAGDLHSEWSYRIYRDRQDTDPVISYEGRTDRSGKKVNYAMGPLTSIYDGRHYVLRDDSSKVVMVSGAPADADPVSMFDPASIEGMVARSNVTSLPGDTLVYSMLLSSEASMDIARVDVYVQDGLPRVMDIFYRREMNIGSAYRPIIGVPRMRIINRVYEQSPTHVGGHFDFEHIVKEGADGWELHPDYGHYQLIVQ